ncbi:NAD(P)-dependent oxidoreductase [Tessaracoccus lacteus]|uniref:NAD(P)-dependent oxidoreductase n=1 Tax=Tessaracoccus lacteus TaxID=3041766 RepID=A0ABY8PZA8_9ACTN|nr:NAD(P)-dependent oxidoreductase [Tessaracoccus sp. T21]WGT47819.1 NAD(P)-dependent oxidoreductase [Tessaracoccus sp. T21]
MKVLVPDAVRDTMPTIDGVEYVIIPASSPVPDEHLDAEVLVAWGQPPAVLQDAARRMTGLRLVQGFLAGPDSMVAAGFPEGVQLSSGVGLHDGPVAEHALGMALALVRNVPLALQRMREHAWDPYLNGSVEPRGADGSVSTLNGANVTIWGFGSIASRLAPLLTALGARVTGAARSAGERHGYPVVAEDRLAATLADTDVLVMILPSTEATTKALSAERLEELKPGALLVNVGRGSTVDETALIGALASGHLAGAAIDVAATEPLPADSPLWDAPNLLITPHVAGGRPQNPGDLLRHNIDAVLRGEGDVTNPIR